MIRYLKSLLVRQDCYACERPLTQQESYICFDCLGQMEPTHFDLHPTENELFYRLAGRVPLAGAASLYYFDKAGRLQTLMQALKYEDAPQIGLQLGKILGQQLRNSRFAGEVDSLIPVPLHSSKQRKRGYNQAEYIARGISDQLGIPVRNDLLFRIQKTASQARKAGRARWENVAHAFEAFPNQPKSVLIIDDVITTGATLEACMRALLSTPHPPEIRVASIGMTRKH